MEPLGQVSNLIVHHSASPRDTTTPKKIREWHRARGFEDIGYHWVITADGEIHRGRPQGFKGAHCKGRNWDSWGVCVVGDNTKASERWNEDQAASLVKFVRAIRLIMPGIGVYGHRDVEGGETATECPGLDFAAWMADRGL